MLKDSTQLATLKGKLARWDDSKRSHDKASAQAPAERKDADPGNADPAILAEGHKRSGQRNKTTR